MTIAAGNLWPSAFFFGSSPGFVNRTQSHPGFVNPVRSGPGFVNPIRSDPIQSGPAFVNAQYILYARLFTQAQGSPIH